ncbi:hypothetical protein IFM46972_03310 [Aspergillus udagawae]|uniref:Uncharacterized protein n=1 Tax=Aspergillus udagawae TaxID=91492 RepID=A0A8H3RN93_9EURO|nr:hypothetical protein IFM46972_03310 [Aspergillus udagawae]
MNLYSNRHQPTHRTHHGESKTWSLGPESYASTTDILATYTGPGAGHDSNSDSDSDGDSDRGIDS